MCGFSRRPSSTACASPRRSRSRASVPAVLPATAVPAAVNGAWKRLPVKGLARRSVGLAYRRRGMLSPQAQGVARHRARRRAGPGDRSARLAPRPPRTRRKFVADASRDPGRHPRLRHRAGRRRRRATSGRARDRSDPTARARSSSDDGESIAHRRAHRARPSGSPSSATSRRAAPTSSRAWPPCTAGGWRPGRSPTARASSRSSSPSTGPAVSGPALLLGLADLVVMTDRRVRVRRAARRWSPSSPACAIDTDELGGAARPRPLHRRGVARRRRRRGRRERGRAAARLPARDTPTRSRRAGRPTTRSTGSTPEAGDAHAGDVRPAATTCATVDPRRSSTTASCSSCAARWAPNLVTAFATIGGRPVGHRRQPAARDRRHARHPGVAEGRPLRRVLRRVQPADHHARRHARLLPGQGPRVAGHDPPRRAARRSPTPGRRCPGSASSCARATAAPTSSWTPRRWATTSASRGRPPSSR